MNYNIPGGKITEEGLRQNISVALQYLESWLRGTGAVVINNLMEDAATAEISRAQIWQWLHNPDTKLADGRKVTPELYRSCFSEELEKIKSMVGDERYSSGKYKLASQLFDQFATEEKFTDFLTLIAYKHL